MVDVVGRHNFVSSNGEIITKNIDEDDLVRIANTNDAITVLTRIFSECFTNVECVPIVGITSTPEVFTVKADSDEGAVEYTIGFKSVTPGGKKRVEGEDRIQPQGISWRKVYSVYKDGGNAFWLGLYKRDGVEVLVAWAPKNTESDSPNSYKVSTDTIAGAKRYGFMREDRNRYLESVCAFTPNFLPAFLTNVDIFLCGKKDPKFTEVKEQQKEEIAPDGQQRNLIYFGAPGTGKSYTLNKEAADKFDADKIERVTFHPDYTYAQFVGTLKPHSGVNDDGKHEVYYAYTPGPFIDTYVKAVNDPANDYLLIIEELNRANPAAVFGDIFQLLDRGTEGSSDYPVKTSEDLKVHLVDRLRPSMPASAREELAAELSLPSNMYIWATMNSADQGVFHMDTAFKRRWNFRYMGIDDGESVISGPVINLGNTGRKVKWNDFRKRINEILLNARVNEDKLLGPFFIDPDLIEDEKAFNDAFKSKVLLYLIEDAAKTKKANVFQMENATYSAIVSAFDAEGERIFRGMESLSTYNDNTLDEHTDEGVDEEVE